MDGKTVPQINELLIIQFGFVFWWYWAQNPEPYMCKISTSHLFLCSFANYKLVTQLYNNQHTYKAHILCYYELDSLEVKRTINIAP